MGALRAELMDGSSGCARAVQVAVLPDRLLIHSEDGSELEAWGLAGLQVDPLPGGVLHLTHAAYPGESRSSSRCCERCPRALRAASRCRSKNSWLSRFTAFWRTGIAGTPTPAARSSRWPTPCDSRATPGSQPPESRSLISRW